jgi:protein-tyrosine phosphatase
MIDVHCHILPGIDDGAQNLDESIELINTAINDGISHIVAMPHIHPGRFDNNNIASINSAIINSAIYPMPLLKGQPKPALAKIAIHV